MNEQQLADLFSEQVDRLLRGDAGIEVPDVEDLRELLELSNRISQTQFQVSAAAQAAFQGQVASWFGPLNGVNGGTSATILGLSKTWLIGIVISIMVATAGLGLIAMIGATALILDADDTPEDPAATIAAVSRLPGTPMADIDDDDDEGRPTITPVTPLPVITGTAAVTTTLQPPAVITLPIVPTGTVTPGTPPVSEPPATLIPPTPGEEAPADPFVLHFPPNLGIPALCQGAYITQRTLVNTGNTPIDDAALAWEVIEGADLIETVNIVSPSFAEVPAEPVDPSTPVVNSSPISATSSVVNFNQIAAQEEVNLDVKVKVNSKWWKEPDGTKIKVKLSIKSKTKSNENDDDDENDDRPAPSQTLVIVKQGAHWVTIKGFAHSYGNQSLLVDGNIVNLNNCTGLPPQLPPGSEVEVIGMLQPDGTFIAINIIIININIFTGDFDSGVPVGGDGGDNDGGGGSGGSGGGNDGDHDRGHGNDADGHDEDNPGRSGGKK